MNSNQYNLKDISNQCIDQEICTNGRIHKIRACSKRCFIILRDQIWSIQCVFNRNNEEKEEFKKICKIPCESFVVIKGIIKRLPENVPIIKNTYHKNFELYISNIQVISKSVIELPFNLDDVDNLYGNKDRNNVLLHTRLENRYFDLRAPFNNSIFKVRSAVCNLFRKYLLDKDFMEINSPKIIGTASEGGSSVFQVEYFGSSVYLAQSPQLYKQMCINSDFNRVFEIGPVFRAEKSISYRHLCEYTSFDIEMALTPGRDYYEVIEMLWGILCYTFDKLKTVCKEQLSYIQSIYPYQDLIYPKQPLIIDFKEGVHMLREMGYIQHELEDLNSENEKILGDLIKKKYGSDLFVLYGYPSNIRPFYTMSASDNPQYSNSYDFIMRGVEILSGSQRIHDYSILLDRINDFGINKSDLADYIKSFSYGSKPHGGGGIGIERIVMLYLAINDVHETSLYPRDPKRVSP